MRFKNPERPHIVDFELTAMIDVILLLIIFFMTTAQFVQRARADLELPKEQGEEEARVETPPLVVNVLARDEGDGRFIIGQQNLTADEVLDVIDREIARLRVDGSDVSDFELVIRADRRGAAMAINELGRGLRKRGVAHWRLATEQPR